VRGSGAVSDAEDARVPCAHPAAAPSASAVHNERRLTASRG
jgi:hypothetical protein